MADRNISKITLNNVTYNIKDSVARAGLENIPTKVSQLQNDSGYLTEHQSLDGYAEKATTLAGYGITDAYTKTESDNKYDVKGAAAERVKSVSKKDNSIDLTGTKEISIGVKLSTNANNQLSLQSDGLYVPKPAAQTNYTVSMSESTPDGYAKAYTLTQNGATIGTINIPKDLVVESGTVETNPSGQPAGTYLVLTLANTTSDKIYINVGSLIEYVTSGSDTSDSVQIVIDETTHKVTAYIKDGTVTKAKLDSSVQSSLDKADSSLSTTGDATNVTNTITTASTRANLVSGETLGISLGKIRKWFNDLKAVSFSGSYNDLSDKPTIPSKTSELTNDSNFATEEYVQENTPQSDWNQNDDTAVDYVKNRPFYTGDPVETYIVQNPLFSQSDGDDTMKFYLFSSPIELTVGTKYTVYFNSMSYECVCALFNGGAAVLGNLSILGLGDDTGEPFLIFTDNSSQSGVYTTYTSDTPSVSISIIAPEIVKIDEKYLPVATDDSYGAVKTSNLVTPYNLPRSVRSSDMIKAIDQFNESKAVIIWDGNFVYDASYDSSDSSIYITYSNDPFVIYKYEIDPNSHVYTGYAGSVNAVNEFGADRIFFKKKNSSGSYENYNLDVYNGVLEFNGKAIAYKHSIKTSLLKSSKWDATTKTYSFESTYPNASYDIEIALDSTSTAEQAEAFNGAQIVGSATSNIIKAYGDVPTVDIPVIVKVVRK